MSQDFNEGSLNFKFPDDWLVCRAEHSKYYKEKFQKFVEPSKEMDFFAYEPAAKTLWLIEVKDYRSDTEVEKREALVQVVAKKTRDSLALILAGGHNDNSDSAPPILSLREFWKQAKKAEKLRIVLHCEFRQVPSRLYPVQREATNLQQKLRIKFKDIDPRALHTYLDHQSNVTWEVAPA